MKSMEIPEIEFPEDVKAKIREIAVKTNSSDDAVVTLLMTRFFELVDDSRNQDVPDIVKMVREVIKDSHTPRSIGRPAGDLPR
jgi:hypothetical protein